VSLRDYRLPTDSSPASTPLQEDGQTVRSIQYLSDNFIVVRQQKSIVRFVGKVNSNATSIYTYVELLLCMNMVRTIHALYRSQLSWIQTLPLHPCTPCHWTSTIRHFDLRLVSDCRNMYSPSMCLVSKHYPKPDNTFNVLNILLYNCWTSQLYSLKHRTKTVYLITTVS
jgi:hypothetical protein